MKNLASFLFILVSVFVFAQHPESDMKTLRDSEAERFMRLSNFNVNPNTLNYDLQYQRIELSLDPAVAYISGKITSHFVPNASISSIYFDFTDGLSVSEVLYHGNPLVFQQLSTKELKIDFPTALSASVLDSLSIQYSGIPSTVNRGIYFQNHSTGPAAFTVTEPYGSREWFPTKQSLNDKIERVDLKITAPSQYSTAGNGLLISETETAGNKTAFWKTEYPIPAYLIAIGVSNYVKSNTTMGTPPFPYVNYLFPQTASNSGVQENLEWTSALLEMFEEHFGPYPYRNEKYGHMEFTFTGSGMEHATMSSMGLWTKDIIAHELAHQWFGDKITCGTWNDIWLNEGFATFGQHMNNEKMVMSHPEFMNYLQSQLNIITSAPNGSVYVPDALLGDIYAIFSGRLTYAKAGYVLRVLKWILGEELFYQALKDYAAKPELSYGYAVTSDFQNSLQATTGKDFSWFMNDWIYGQGYPTYEIRWNQSGNSLGFTVSQTQSDASVDFFELPLPIKVNGSGGETAFLVLENNQNNQYFQESVPFVVSSVEFNYEYQLIEKNSTVVHDPNLAIGEVLSKKIQFYPNPAQDIVHIKGINGNFSYEIFSLDGKKVKTGTSNGSINLADLIPGIYFVSVENQRFKLIKE